MGGAPHSSETPLPRADPGPCGRDPEGSSPSPPRPWTQPTYVPLNVLRVGGRPLWPQHSAYSREKEAPALTALWPLCWNGFGQESMRGDRTSAWGLIRGVGDNRTAPPCPGAFACSSVKMEEPRAFQGCLKLPEALAVQLGEPGFRGLPGGEGAQSRRGEAHTDATPG